jgi:ribonuclease HI
MDLLAELKDIRKQITKLRERENEIVELLKNEKEDNDTEPQVTLNTDTNITVYTDGACSGNPGPAGSGVVIIQDNEIVHEISQSLGDATNNIAELTAIKLTLEYLHDHKDTEITLFTDSKYCIGSLTKDWKAKANVKLIADIKKVLMDFTKLSFEYIKGHSGNVGNERADELAVRAIDGAS